MDMTNHEKIIEELRKENEELKELLLSLEWSNDYVYCPVCNGTEYETADDRPGGHFSDCELSEILDIKPTRKRE